MELVSSVKSSRTSRTFFNKSSSKSCCETNVRVSIICHLSCFTWIVWSYEYCACAVAKTIRGMFFWWYRLLFVVYSREHQNAARSPSGGSLVALAQLVSSIVLLKSAVGLVISHSVRHFNSNPVFFITCLAQGFHQLVLSSTDSLANTMSCAFLLAQPDDIFSKNIEWRNIRTIPPSIKRSPRNSNIIIGITTIWSWSHRRRGEMKHSPDQDSWARIDNQLKLDESVDILDLIQNFHDLLDNFLWQSTRSLWWPHPRHENI